MSTSPDTDTAATGSEQSLIANGLRLVYDQFGDRNDPAVLLIMGLGTQMIAWSELFCNSLAAHGYRVIRFDNRDIGLSEKIETKKRVSIPSLMFRSRFRLPMSVPYKLDDMALDTVGVLDALEIESAHIVGASMGGMIAQLVTAGHPDRVKTLTSIMSTTGNPRLPRTSWEVTRLLLNRPRDHSEEALLEHAMNVWRVIGSPAYPPSDEALRERILYALRRSYYPQGYLHQLAAIIENGDRRRLLRTISTPTLVIHGTADVLVPVEGGIDTAKQIPDARLELIDGMGHDLPVELVPRLVELIADHAGRG